jgi:hypothetical protein
MKHRVLFLFLLLVVAVGCSDTSIAPMVGMWQGGFDGKPTDPGVTERPEWVYKGYLQLYATGMKFKMHLESEVQIVDVSGTWTHKKEKIYVSPVEVAFDDRGGELMQRPGAKPVDPELIRQALSHELVFTYKPNPQSLVGLEMTLGPMLGHFAFTKGRE